MDETTNDPAQTQENEITIEPSVVAGIIRLCALDVDGVYSVGKGVTDRLSELFFKRESDRGVQVSEDEHGAYRVKIRVIMQFGAPLQQTAKKIQETIREKVLEMTGKPVTTVHVLVDGVHTASYKRAAKQEPEDHTADLPHTD